MTRNAPIDRPGLPPSWRLALWGGIAGVLALPAVAMQFSREVNWGPGDFLAAALLLGLTGLGLELAARAPLSRRLRIAAALALVVMLLLIWAELAVGIIPQAAASPRLQIPGL